MQVTGDQKIYWAEQIEWAVKTIGISGVLLCALLYGIYQITLRGIEFVAPQLDRIVESHSQFLASEIESRRKMQTSLEQLVHISGQQSELIAQTSQQLQALHKRLDGIEAQLKGKTIHE
jgi:hypothetical protein